MIKIGLIWVFIISFMCFTRIDALFLDVPPKQTQYVDVSVFVTNFHWIHGRRTKTLFGLCIEGKDGNEYYLHYDAIEGNAEELRNRINWSESRLCRIGYVPGLMDKLFDSDKKFVVSLECEDELFVDPHFAMQAYRNKAWINAGTGTAWILITAVLLMYGLGLIQIKRK